MKSISTINSAITENAKSLIITEVRPRYWFKVGVLLDRSVSLCFISSYFEHIQ